MDSFHYDIYSISKYYCISSFYQLDFYIWIWFRQANKQQYVGLVVRMQIIRAKMQKRKYVKGAWVHGVQH